MSSLKPFNMTFTEDDLRSVKSRQSPYSDQISTPIRSETPSRISTTPKRTPTPTRLLTPPRIGTPPAQKVSPFRVSTAERRQQVKKILAEEEREYQLRKLEKQQNENEAHLKEQLKRLEEERKKADSRNLSNTNATRLFTENEYKRFSNSRYYKWDSEEDLQRQHHGHGHSREHILEDEPLHEEHCELCRRGLEQERLERERRLAKLRARSQSEHCRTIQRFVDEVNDKN